MFILPLYALMQMWMQFGCNENNVMNRTDSHTVVIGEDYKKELDLIAEQRAFIGGNFPNEPKIL